MENLIQTLAINALPVVFAITLHEAAHGYVARHFGDPTAWQLGRVSANPLRHIDPFGTIILPGLLLLISNGALLFGWAKPVPVDFRRLRNPKRDMLWVAAAGPAANFGMAIAWGILLKASLVAPDFIYADALREMGRAGVNVNVIFMALNLLPIPPLDGGRMVVSLLPNRAALRFASIEGYGLVIIIVLLATGALDFLLYPILRVVLMAVKNIIGL